MDSTMSENYSTQTRPRNQEHDHRHQYFQQLCPLPTLSANQPRFNPRKGYWRGPVWIDNAYVAIKGLKTYGYDQEAGILRDKLVQNAEGLLEKGKPIHENYHPIAGETLGVANFCWSAAHFLLLYLDSDDFHDLHSGEGAVE